MPGGTNGGGSKKHNKQNNQRVNVLNNVGGTRGFSTPSSMEEDAKTENPITVKLETKIESKQATAADSTVDKDVGHGLNKRLGDLQLKDATEELDEENQWATSGVKVGRKGRKGAKSGAGDKPTGMAKSGANDKSTEDTKSSHNPSKLSEPGPEDVRTRTAPTRSEIDIQATPIVSEDTQITLTMSDKGTETDPIELEMSKPISADKGTQTTPTTGEKGTQIDPILTAMPKSSIPKHNPTPFIPPNINTSDPIIHLTSNNTSFVSAHMGLLTRHSAYFSEFFAPGPVQTKKYRYGPASTRTVMSLKDCWAHEPRESVLQIYTEWLYNGKLDRLVMTDEIFKDLVGLYVFGEQVLDAVFCNAVMDLFTRLLVRKRCLVLGDGVAMVYGMTSKGSKLRQVVADMYAYNGVEDGSGLRDLVEEMPKEFLFDVVVKMAGLREAKSREWWVRLVEQGYYVE